MARPAANEAELIARFWERVDRRGPDECWDWTRGRTGGGYGTFYFVIRGIRRSWGAHVVAHEVVNGPVPDGYQVDHRCFRPSCVNPAHLEAVTGLVNRQRANQRRLDRLGDTTASAHGTHTRYSRGCRCEPCRRGRSEYMRKMKAKKAATGPSEHGVIKSYLYYGCRCDLCRDAWCAYKREWRRRQKNASAA